MNSELPVGDSISTGLKLQAPQTSWFGLSDWVGMVASIGCAIHCAAMPFAIAYLPALGLSFLADESFHKWMAGGCFIIALSAFVPGFRKHRRFTPVIIGCCGLSLITVAAFGFAGECCAACDQDATTAACAVPINSENAISLTTTSTVDAEPCTEACCSEQEDEETAMGHKATFTDLSLATRPPLSSDSSSLASRIVPWMTSIGGCVLVLAHLMNRRYGCLCGCCDVEVAEVSA